MYIQTVYLPLENVDYVEYWIKYHMSIGIQHFFLYDNTGSTLEPYDRGFSIEINGKNRHGFVFSKNDYEYAIKKESEIFKKYPVTKIPWNPIHNGKKIYGQVEAALHFARYMKKGLCAFVDIDEFIVPGSRGLIEGRMTQKRMKSRFYFNSVTECNEVFNIQHRDWSPKLILDLDRLAKHKGDMPDSIHFYSNDFMKLPYLDTYFNHYSHSERHHKVMLPDVINFIQNNIGDKSFNPRILDFNNSFYHEDQSAIFKEVVL